MAMREIPIEILEGFKVPDAVLLCRRGDTWTVERDGLKAGAFISGSLRDCERLYPEPNGQLILSRDGGDTVSARISAISAKFFSVAEKILGLRDISAEESYEMLLSKAVGSRSLVNLGNLIATIMKAAETARIQPDRHIVLSHGTSRIQELVEDICNSWAREAVSRIAKPSRFPDVEIPNGLTDEILDSALQRAGEDQAVYDDLRSDIEFAQGIIRAAFGKELESEAGFYDSSATDNVCSMLEAIDTSGCIVILKDSASGVCDYLFSDTASFTRAQPRNVGDFVAKLTDGRYGLGNDSQEFELILDGGKLILDETPGMAHGNMKFEVLFIVKSLSDKVIALENAELSREMSRLHMRRGSSAEDLLVRLAETTGGILNIERDICAIFGWEFTGNGRMESLNDLMEAVDLEPMQPQRPAGSGKTRF
ncbi:hypothetical protein [Collinsella sp. CLA-AA-H302]|uniref:hypothetical protein n=1 Tax=Collinsella sp. CLA-AA-H302 TaxID=3136217 RepID=UPI0032BF728C